MKAIIGLGNPGEKYKKSRHNLGFMVVDRLLLDLEPLKKTYWESASVVTSARRGRKVESLVKRVRVKDKEILLAKSQTFMNNSGVAVKKLIENLKLKIENSYVIHDDLDLPFGKIRVRFGGAAGGHKGVQSIIEALGTDKFLRVRLGIGKPKRIQNSEFRIKNYKTVEEYVLSNFEPNERGKARTMVRGAVRAVKLLVEHGVEKYMGKYNK